MKKVRPISGFPEWSPEEKLIEQRVIDIIREKFELFGFTPIETRAVEPLEHLIAKGETDKEIYTLRRLQAEGDADAGAAEFGLHFDLTIPFARYVAERRGTLVFPFKRYQIQKAWRGERPQEGRYREFYQADIDVIAENELPLHHDAEIIHVIHEVLSALPIPPIRFAINNRKVLQGFYHALGIEDVHGVLRAVDKLDKIGEGGVRELLTGEVGLDPKAAEQCLRLGAIGGSDASVVAAVRALGLKHDLLEEGLDELAFVLDSIKTLPEGSVVADLHIARGFDYYTGTVYEGSMVGHESVGAVCSGGRYDNLASEGTKPKLPGVGISIGISRILGRLLGKGLLKASRSTPTCVLVSLVSDERREESISVARSLRSRGICTEVFDRPLKYGKQIRYAERKGIPFVWFTESEKSEGHAVLDIRGGEQVSADAESWEPPEEDIEVSVYLKS